MRTKTIKKEPPPPPPSVIETFYDPRGYSLNQFVRDEPNCFNGWVNFRRFRVTVEEIEEPKEVLAERLLKMWRDCDNSHHWEPLKAAAAQIGIGLPQGEMGINRRKR
jgi:hypothetical protein